MSRTSFDQGHDAISKAETVAWLHLGLLLTGGACLVWLWWSSWPDGGVLRNNAAMLQPWLGGALVAAVGLVWAVKLRGRKAPLEDERDRAINGQARANGFAALAIMVVLLCVAVRTQGLLQDHLTADWLTLGLMSILTLAFLVDATYRLVRYRIG